MNLPKNEKEFLKLREKAKEKNGCTAISCAGCKHISVWKGCDYK